MLFFTLITTVLLGYQVRGQQCDFSFTSCSVCILGYDNTLCDGDPLANTTLSAGTASQAIQWTTYNDTSHPILAFTYNFIGLDVSCNTTQFMFMNNAGQQAGTAHLTAGRAEKNGECFFFGDPFPTSYYGVDMGSYDPGAVDLTVESIFTDILHVA